MKLCKMMGCNKLSHTKGYCKSHYDVMRNNNRRAAIRAYTFAHREEKMAYLREYRIVNREKLNRDAREQYARDPGHRAYIHIHNRNYHAKHKASLNKKSREYYQEHKEQRKATGCVWERKKRRMDPVFRLKKNFQNAVRRALRGRKEGRPWEDIVGYTIHALISHLERQFDDKMSWDNYGSYWHIDHIKPLSSFVYTSLADRGFKQAWRLANLQPLEASENLKKWATYE